MPEMSAKMVGSAFFEIPKESTTIDSTSGWVDPFRPSQPFGPDACVSFGAYLVFAMRCDEYKYDKATVDMLAEKYCIEKGYEKTWKQMKRGYTKQEVIDHVRSVIRNQTIPKTKIVYAFLDYASKQILLMSKSSADATAFMTLFANTFGVDLSPHNYNLQFVPNDSHVKLVMRYLYEACTEGAEYTGSNLDASVYIHDYYGIKMQGIAEKNLGTEYSVKTGDEKVDAVAEQLINLGAADIAELGFTVSSEWGDISFFVNDEKLVPYSIDLPNIGKVEGDELVQNRVNMVIWLLYAWRDVLEGAVKQMKKAAKKGKDADDSTNDKSKAGFESVTISAGGKSVSMTGKQFDKAMKAVKGKTKQEAKKK